MRACGVAMLQLFGSESRDVGRKFGLAVPEFVELAAIMAVYLRFDRVGAGHCRSFGHESSRGAEREASDFPHRLQGRRPYASFGHQCIEPFQVPLLLLRHAGNHPTGRAVLAKHGQLACVNSCCPVFARLVDAEHGVGVYPGAAYHIQRPAPPSILLGFSGLSEAEIEEGVQRLARALQQCRPTKKPT